jgi:glycerol-3-phosphate acyltransferase PlsY
MGTAIALIVCAAIGYLWGSIPTGYWVGRLVAGIDIRDYGSGSTGATNVLRTLGKGPALAVLLVDAIKGVLAVNTVRVLLPDSITWLPFTSEATLLALLPWATALAATLAIVGHSKSIWISWQGGKSAAISLGILLALHWPVALTVLAVWLGTLALSKIVSLSSILAAIASPICMAIFQQPFAYILFAVAGSIYVLVRHHSNMQRLLAGVEPRIGQKLGDESAPAQ